MQVAHETNNLGYWMRAPAQAQPDAPAIRSNFEITEGRYFVAGKNEIIVGRAVNDQYEGLEVGSF